MGHRTHHSHGFHAHASLELKPQIETEGLLSEVLLAPAAPAKSAPPLSHEEMVEMLEDSPAPAVAPPPLSREELEEILE